VKVALIPPPGTAVKVKSPDALVYPVRAQHNCTDGVSRLRTLLG
jgi:hypothetical protein